MGMQPGYAANINLHLSSIRSFRALPLSFLRRKLCESDGILNERRGVKYAAFPVYSCAHGHRLEQEQLLDQLLSRSAVC